MMVMRKGLKGVLGPLSFLLPTLFFSVTVKGQLIGPEDVSVSSFVWRMLVKEVLGLTDTVISLSFFLCVSRGLSLRSIRLCFGCVELDYGNAEFLRDTDCQG